MSLARSLVVIVVSGACFGVAGGLLGFTLGVGAPAYYRGVFHAADDPGFRPVQVGLGLGITQGVTCGLVIGSVVVLAVALSRRPNQASDPDGRPAQKFEADERRVSWVRRAFAILFILAAVACSGVTGFVGGAVIGQVQLYRQSSEARIAKVRPILRERPFVGIEAEATSDGKVDLLGTVGSERDCKALEERLRFLFGDEEARSMTGAVGIAR